MKMLNVLLGAIVVSLCLITIQARASVNEFPNTQRQYGCALMVDQFGEREMTNIYYYPTLGGVVYWDTFYQVWIGPYGYWTLTDGFHSTFPKGYHDHYHHDYHPYGNHRHGGHTC